MFAIKAQQKDKTKNQLKSKSKSMAKYDFLVFYAANFYNYFSY